MGTSEYGHALWLPWREGRVASNRGIEGAVKQKKKKKFKDSEVIAMICQKLHIP